MTAAVLSHHVTAYAAQVRAHLADLTREQLDDLTDGLEADLMEAFEDPARPGTGEIPLASGSLGAPDDLPTDASSRPDGASTSSIDLTERFGTPQAYAEELRAAAGLPAPQSPDDLKEIRPSLGERMAGKLRTDGERLVSQPWWPAVPAIGEALRPLWWVVRGWVLFNIVVTVIAGGENVFFLPKNIFGVLVLLAVVAASIQHGQGRWTVQGRGHHVVTAVSVIATVGILPVVVTASNHTRTVEYYNNNYSEPSPIADGVYVGGQLVTNLFVYDADGTFIDQAQIVDDKGRPVRVDRAGGIWDERDQTSQYWDPATDSYGREIWNAFPLRMWSDRDAVWDDETQTWVLPDGMTGTVVPPPFVQLAPLSQDPSAPAEPEDGAAPADPSAQVDPAAPAGPAAPGDAPADAGDTAVDDPSAAPSTTDPAGG